MIVSCLVCEVMLDSESIRIIGAETYSDYSGYGSTFRWKSINQDRNILRFFYSVSNISIC